jgi:hypothetical protein
VKDPPELRVRAACRVLHIICLLSFAATISAVALPALFVATLADAPDVKVFDVASDPNFNNYKQVVTQFAHKKRPKAANDFCVLGYIAGDDTRSAWVIWHQGGEIILWGGNNADLDSSPRTLNLKSDVVPSESDLHGSTYLVTKAWVENVTATCDRSGEKVHVPADKSPHQP